VQSVQTAICKTVSCWEWQEAEGSSITIAFQLCFKNAIRRAQENQKGLTLNSTHQLLLAYAGDVNIVRKIIFAVQETQRKLN
jgi:hypothetical protein